MTLLQAQDADLLHRWSFDEAPGSVSAVDTVGGADAVLVGAASIAGGKLILPGVASKKDYASVLIGETIAGNDSLTVESWFTVNEHRNWAKVWMFGTDARLSFMDLTPNVPTGSYPSMGIYAPGKGEKNTRSGPNPPTLLTGTSYYFAAVYDSEGGQMRLYINGVLAVSASWDGTVSSLGPTNLNRFGATTINRDEDMKGSIDEIRIWGGVLTDEQIAENGEAGPDIVPGAGGVTDPLAPKISLARKIAGESAGPTAIEVPVTNLGENHDLILSEATIIGIEDLFFHVSSTLPMTIPPGETRNLMIDLDTTGYTGTFEVTLAVESNDPRRPRVSTELSWDVGVAKLEVARVLNFGPIANSSEPQTYAIEIGNSGMGDLEIYQAEFQATAAPDYGPLAKVGHDFVTSSFTVPAKGTRNLEFTFDPSFIAAGTKPLFLELHTFDANNPMVLLTLNMQVTAPVQSTAAVLRHRWSFNEAPGGVTVVDSVGSANGDLWGDVTIANGAAVLPGGGAKHQNFISLPVGLTVARSESLSAEAWVRVSQQRISSKLWLFGTTGINANVSNYFGVEPHSNAPSLPPAAMILPSGTTTESNTRGAPNPPQLPLNTLSHVVAVFNAQAHEMVLYIDGVAADRAAWTGRVSDLGVTRENFLGSATFLLANEDMQGSIEEFRIWQGVLTEPQVARSYNLGPDELPDAEGERYAAWATSHGLTGGPEADEDGDGIPNLMEYMLGSNPKAANSAELAAAQEGGMLVAQFERGKGLSREDGQLLLEYSPHLMGPWQSMAIGLASQGGVTIVPKDAQTELVTVRIPANGAPRMFARLRAVLAP